MAFNIKHILLIRDKGLLLFLLLIFLGVLTSCSLKAFYMSPEETWEYPGGSSPPMSMVFHADGRLTFVGGFDSFHPATWHFDQHRHQLQIKVSNYDKSPTGCETSSAEESSCLLYNPKTDSFECKLTQKTKSITFLGWNFFRK